MFKFKGAAYLNPFLYMEGVVPILFLKTLLNVDLELKPHLNAIVRIFTASFLDSFKILNTSRILYSLIKSQKFLLSKLLITIER